MAPVAAADPVLVVIAEHKTTLCVTCSDIEQAVPVRRDRARDAGYPLASTEGLVTLSAYACDTLSRPEGIIDHTVDDRPRDLERCALTKADGDNDSAERAVAGTESGTA